MRFHATPSDAQRAVAWQAAIRLGIEQIERGDNVSYTTEAAATIKQAAIEAMHNGQSICQDFLQHSVQVSV